MKNITSRVQHVLVAALVMAMIGLSGCKKNGGTADGEGEKFLNCKINGKYYEFNSGVNANDKPSTDTVHFVVIGGWEKPDKIKGFGIGLTLPEGAKEATYTATGPTDLELNGQYYIQEMKDGKIMNTIVYTGVQGEGTNFKLTITSLTEWGVKGTFSGKLELDGGDDVVNVTEGKFSAPYN